MGTKRDFGPDDLVGQTRSAIIFYSYFTFPVRTSPSNCTSENFQCPLSSTLQRYNIGHVAVGVGDLGLAYQSFKIAISVDASHAESYNNLGVLELRKGNIDQAQDHFRTAIGLAEHFFEPAFNNGLLAFKLGEFKDSYEYANKALKAYSEHIESKELLKQLKSHFSTL